VEFLEADTPSIAGNSDAACVGAGRADSDSTHRLWHQRKGYALPAASGEPPAKPTAPNRRIFTAELPSFGLTEPIIGARGAQMGAQSAV
jgi:hypothetical protein